MANQVNITFVKTYKTRENAVKAVQAKLAWSEARYIICQTEDNRFSPLFVGSQALHDQVFFQFNCVN
jgi:hypothetical protein